VRKTSFRVEMARLGRMTNYERLIVDVWTNGAITPEVALSQAAQLVNGHLEIYSRLAGVEQAAAPAEAAAGREEESVLDQSIESLELSIRSMNCLKNANIRTLRDLVARSERQMVEIRNFGEKSLREVREKLEALGLGFGMNLEI
jgi:DNA-directed RNA polymerase subunit alpha